MVWITLIFSLLGPLLGELIKRIFLKRIPELPLAERRAARKEVAAVAKKAFRRDRTAEHGYAVAVAPADLESELEALEAKYVARAAEVKGVVA